MTRTPSGLMVGRRGGIQAVGGGVPSGRSHDTGRESWVEIDFTHEVSRARIDAAHDKHRRRIITAAALTIGLVVGGIVGVTIGKRSGQSGSVTWARVALAGTKQQVVLQWSLAEFGSEDAQMRSALVNDVSSFDGGRPLTRQSFRHDVLTTQAVRHEVALLVRLVETVPLV